MSFEAIKSIAEVERQAEQLKVDAQVKARVLVNAAEEEAVRLRDEGLKEAEAANVKALELAEADAGEEADKIRAADAETLARMKEAALVKKADAVKMVLERIVNG